MPLNTQLSDFAANVAADAVAALLDNGYVDILTGPQAETAGADITSQVVLVTLGFGKPAFMKSQGGVIAANPISSGIGIADGDPRWFRAYRADHKTVVFDGSAGKAKDNNMVLPAKTIIQGVTIGAKDLIHTAYKSFPGT